MPRVLSALRTYRPQLPVSRRAFSASISDDSLDRLKHPVRGGQDLAHRYARLERALRGKEGYLRDLNHIDHSSPVTSDPSSPPLSPVRKAPLVFAGLTIPDDPPVPQPDECCMSGCAVCVHDLHRAALAAHSHALAALRSTLTARGVPRAHLASPPPRMELQLAARREAEAKGNERPRPEPERVVRSSLSKTKNDAKDVLDAVSWLLFTCCPSYFGANKNKLVHSLLILHLHVSLLAHIISPSLPTMSDASNSNATTASTKTFVTALWVNAAVFGIELIAFTVLRPRFRAIYEPRTYIPPEHKRSPPLSSRILAWPLSVWRADYSQILLQNGMDAYFFVRFLRMVVKILLPIWIISWIVLLPLTSVGTSAVEKTSDGLDRFTFGNVGPAQQPRYAAHLVLTWLFTFWIWYVVRAEMKHFVTARQQYLVSPAYARSAQAHTVLVTGVPTRFLSERAIEMLFSQLPGGVKKVWLNRDLKELPDLYDRRLAACSTLESAETSLLKAAAEALAAQRKADDKAAGIDKKTPDLERTAAAASNQSVPDLATLVAAGDRPTHRLPVGPLPFALPLIGKKVDSIEWARKEIAETGAALERGRVVLRRETDMLEAGGVGSMPLRVEVSWVS
ncbi:hypothetical protein EW145_g5565, partial [Phellinidium pouzarii]